MKFFPISFQAKLFCCFLAVTALSMLVPVFYVRPVLHEAILHDNLERLRQEALLVGSLLETQKDPAELAAVSSALKQTEIRLSVMNPQGAILFESSQSDGTLPENHADRPEMQEAMRSGQGSATRFSTTLRMELMYVALRLENGNILRLAVPFAGVERRIDAQVAGISLAAAAAVALSLLLAWFFSNRIKHSLAGMIGIVEGISRGKFSRRLHIIPGKEFQPLADAVNRMAESMEASLLTLADQKNQLEAVLETMAEGVLVLDPKGRIRRVNRAFVASFPRTVPQNSYGKSLPSAVKNSEESRLPARFEGRQLMECIPSPSLQEAAERLLNDDTAYGENTVLQITVYNTVFSVLLARPLEEAEDTLGLVAVFRDITELVRLETIRRDFVANVSHELRTPLTAIQGYAETLSAMGDIPDQGRRFAEIIRKHGMFLSAMVDELLTLSRLESDSFRLESAPVKTADALGRAVQMLQTTIDQKHLHVTETLMPGLVVQADSFLLERVFRNLLENACRYAPEGSDITVSAQTNEREVVFAVSDQGTGIPPAEIGRIFERFYQVEKHRGSSRVGGGLGLAICKHIVERHHGRIWVQSPTATAATTFFFTLPLEAVPGSNGENR